MAQKMQEDKAVLVFEYVGILPVIKIAMSDNRESRPKEVKTQFLSFLFTLEAPNFVRAPH
jgi:hypothetical protein